MKYKANILRSKWVENINLKVINIRNVTQVNKLNWNKTMLLKAMRADNTSVKLGTIEKRK